MNATRLFSRFGQGENAGDDLRRHRHHTGRPLRVMRRAASLRVARKAARRDLESRQPLVRRTPFQRETVAAYRAAKAAGVEDDAVKTRSLKEQLAEIGRRIRWRIKQVKDASAKLPEVAKKLETLHPTQLLARINTWVYLLLQSLFALAEYPLVKIAFRRLPVDDGTIRLISILVGCVLVAGMHVLGGVAARTVQAEGERLEGRRNWHLHVAVLSAGVVFYVGVVVALGVVRASEISGVGELLNGAGQRHPGWLGVALAALHAISLAASFVLAYWHARGAEWRAIKAEMDALEQRIEEAERQLEDLEASRDRIHVTLAESEAETANYLERLLRFHEHLEAEYLAILARELEVPPLAVANWDADADATESVHDAGRRAVSNAARNNGRGNTKAARRNVRAAVSDIDRKED